MTKVIIRDLRNGEWSWVYNALIGDPHLTPAEKCIYASLASWGGCDSIHPSFEEIAKRASLSVRVAKTAIKKLNEVGYLETKTGGGNGKSNEYQLLKISKGCKICTEVYCAENDRDTVQKTTTNCAKSALPLYKINKKIIKLDKIFFLFEKFWNEYPKKIGKKNTEKIFIKINPDTSMFEKIIQSLTLHKKTSGWSKDSGQFIPHPSTWLNQERWNDEIQVESGPKVDQF